MLYSLLLLFLLPLFSLLLLLSMLAVFGFAEYTASNVCLCICMSVCMYVGSKSSFALQASVVFA